MRDRGGGRARVDRRWRLSATHHSEHHTHASDCRKSQRSGGSGPVRWLERRVGALQEPGFRPGWDGQASGFIAVRSILLDDSPKPNVTKIATPYLAPVSARDVRLQFDRGIACLDTRQDRSGNEKVSRDAKRRHRYVAIDRRPLGTVY
jgi:hypothetical protein